MAGLIKSGESKDSATLRGRDVEYRLKDVELHPTVKAILYELAEHSHIQNKGIAELAAMMEQLVDTYQNVVNIAGEMKQANDKFNTFIGNADVDEDIGTRNN